MIDVITQGKTKKILQDPGDPNVVMIQSKDDVTAGDGNRRVQLKDKGMFATATTCNVFEFLATKGVPMAYIGRAGDIQFLAQKLDMLPLEFVARRKAWGSFMDRALDVEKGTTFKPLVTEVFLKDDSRHDPLIVFDSGRQRYILHDSHAPLPSGELDVFDPTLYTPWDLVDFRGYESMLKQMTGVIFEALEVELSKHNVELVDFKVEFGRADGGAVRLGDVIDADSWRAWPDGDPEKGIDKQYFRDMPEVTDERLKKLHANYLQAAEITSRFIGVTMPFVY